MDKLHYIESLIEKFLEGRTTNAEERELYAWFATADVPKEWSDLKAMFAWYAEGMPEQKATALPKPRMTSALRFVGMTRDRLGKLLYYLQKRSRAGLMR